MFEIKHDLEYEVIESMFAVNNNSIQLRSESDFCVPKINAKYFGENQYDTYVQSCGTLFFGK